MAATAWPLGKVLPKGSFWPAFRVFTPILQQSCKVNVALKVKDTMPVLQVVFGGPFQI